MRFDISLVIDCNIVASSSTVHQCNVQAGSNQFEHYDALIHWDPFHESRPRFCDPCTKFVETYVRDEREKRWKHLPQLLGLGEWENIIEQASEETDTW